MRSLRRRRPLIGCVR
uniref:Uncharacterized protein n=1 Tax=Anguilla anguilla TaxID=7936 RepID=A0A0E9TW91_ANGAN